MIDQTLAIVGGLSFGLGGFIVLFALSRMIGNRMRDFARKHPDMTLREFVLEGHDPE